MPEDPGGYLHVLASFAPAGSVHIQHSFQGPGSAGRDSRHQGICCGTECCQRLLELASMSVPVQQQWRHSAHETPAADG